METKKENVFQKLNSDKKEVLETEVLFKSKGEDLVYMEPKKAESQLIEEGIYFVSPKLEGPSDIETEVLFKSGIEEIEVKDEEALKEESLAFQEPQKPNFVAEEVLFGDEEDSINYSLFDGDNANEEAKEYLSTDDLDDNGESDKYQISFGDLDAIALNALQSQTVIEKKKVIKKRFIQKLLEADETIQANYQELKNILLSYKKVKSRISNTADTFNMGRTKLAKLSVTGKSLKLYLNLDFNEVESRLKCRNSADTKAYEEVPVFLRIRSRRAMKNARYLISKLAERFELKVNPKAVEVDAINLAKERLEELKK